MHFGELQVGCHVPFTVEWLLSGHSTMKAWLVECCRDGCPISTVELWSSIRVTIGFLVNSLTKAILPNCKVCPLCSWGPSMLQKCLIPFPRSVPRHNPVSELYGQFLWPHNLFFALTCTVNYETLYRQVCAFPNHFQLIEFTTCGLQSSCRNISRIISWTWMHLNSKSSLTAKGLNTYVRYCLLYWIHVAHIFF